MNTNENKQSVLPARIESRIYFLRRQKVMLSPDLAVLYHVEPRALMQAVKRNSSRFPADFMFQLSPRESRNLKSQFVTSTWGGARRARAYAFTEQGIAMLSSVLRSERAVQVNIAIMRAFLKLRAMLASHEDLRRKIMQLEKRYDSQFHAVFETLRQMLETPVPTKRRIGFNA